MFHLKKLGPDANKNLLSRVQQVQMTDVVRVMEKYLVTLFDTRLVYMFLFKVFTFLHSKTNVAITCNPSKIEEATTSFENMKRKLISTKVDELFK
jgi:hypothetical protein